jgi:uncharacterized protein
MATVNSGYFEAAYRGEKAVNRGAKSLQTDARLKELATVLSNLTDDFDGMLISEFDGFCTALALGSEQVPLYQWLPIVFGGDGRPRNADFRELKSAFELIIGHYEGVAYQLNRSEKFFEPIFERDDSNVHVFWEDWIYGFGQAMNIKPEIWLGIYEETKNTLFCGVARAIENLWDYLAISKGQKILTKRQRILVTKDAPAEIKNAVHIIRAWSLAKHKSGCYLRRIAANSNLSP